MLGMAFAMPWPKENKAMGAWLACAGMVGLIVVYLCFARFTELLNDYAMYWHPFVLIAPALCAGLGWLFGRLPSCVGRVFAWLGKASFEIFLFNVWAEVLGKKFGLVNTPAQWLMLSVATIVLGLAYHWLIGKIVRKWLTRRSEA